MHLCPTSKLGYLYFKESGPFVETPHIFLYMQNIYYAEILA